MVPAGPNVDGPVLTLYADLCDHVRHLVGRRGGALPGFMDRSMGGGELWDPHILDKVRRARVLVALVSAGLVESDACGKEWDVFSRRRRTPLWEGSSAFETTILPVVWVPFPDYRLPAVIKAVQRFTPDVHHDKELSGLYQLNGVYGLLTGGATYKSQYDDIVWQLARRIAALYYAFEVPEGDPVTGDELRNVFKEAE
jgi:hypothetical protein